MNELDKPELRLVPREVENPKPLAACSFQALTFLERSRFLRQSLCSSVTLNLQPIWVVSCLYIFGQGFLW